MLLLLFLGGLWVGCSFVDVVVVFVVFCLFFKCFCCCYFCFVFSWFVYLLSFLFCVCFFGGGGKGGS